MQEQQKKPKPAPIIIQMAIYGAILFVAGLISALFPKSFVVPPSLIGMIILYVLLSTHVIKLEWVEGLANSLIGMIAFLFVPSGIQLAGSLGIMKREGLQDLVVIVVATVIMLVVISYVGALFMWLHRRVAGGKADSALATPPDSTSAKK